MTHSEGYGRKDAEFMIGREDLGAGRDSEEVLQIVQGAYLEIQKERLTGPEANTFF